MVETLNDIFKKISKKEYEILTSTYRTPDTDSGVSPIFEQLFFTNNQSNAFIIYGENASGKSLITKIISNRLYDKSIKTRSVSMTARTESGIKRAFLIGSDATQSTGETSFTFLKKAFGGMQSEDPSLKSLSIFDEPDIGLSSRYARALGRYFAEQQKELPDTKAIIIISHNEHFLKSFLNHSQGHVSSLGINTNQTLENWLDDDIEYSVEQLVGLTQLGRSKFSGIEAGLSAIRKNS